VRKKLKQKNVEQKNCLIVRECAIESNQIKSNTFNSDIHHGLQHQEWSIHSEP